MYFPNGHIILLAFYELVCDYKHCTKFLAECNFTYMKNEGQPMILLMNLSCWF